MHGPTLFHDVPDGRWARQRQVRDDLGLSDDKQLVPHACRHSVPRVWCSVAPRCTQFKGAGHSNISAGAGHLNPEVQHHRFART